MIIGANKEAVINNIKESISQGEFNSKVEIGDPELTSAEKSQIINKYLENRNKVSFKIKTKIAKSAISMVTSILHKETEIIGLENIKDVKGSCIITSNHFNPLDNLIIQKFAKEIYKKRLYIVSQVTNLAVKGPIGFFMNYSDIIPITDQMHYMKREFPRLIKNTLNDDNLILIYPEQEMWFNYNKPRPLKEGAYYFAAKCNVPVISCFVEMIETSEKDNDEFNKVKYVLHILKPIYPDSNISAKENSIIMRDKDFEQKKNAYEKAYNKKLDYKFELEDISGWRKRENI